VSDSTVRRDSGTRAAAPAVAIATLLAVTVVLAAAVGGLALTHVPDGDGEPTTVALSLSVRDDRVSLVHRGGPPLDVRDLRLRVTVDGVPLSSQPPVPFFSAAGFRPGPTGPFNSASHPAWSVGETASFRVAGTNRPAIDDSSTVGVTVYADGRPVTRLEATA
jgi:FlaG/FlaF family flagellin (archaellin)